jgi:hypothetical protein
VGLSPGWYLYRIDVSKNNDLGFIVPYELSKVKYACQKYHRMQFSF